jgi:hypothetical protein
VGDTSSALTDNPINEAKDNDERQKNLKKISGKFNNISSADEKEYKEIILQQFLPISEAEIQGLLHPAQANLGYFLP